MTVDSDIAFAMLVRVKSAWIYIDVGVKFLDRNGVSS